MLNKILTKPLAVAAIILVAVITLFTIIFFSSLSGNQSTMVKKEARLSAKYSDNQNVLSTYKKTIKEAMGVSQTSTAAQNQVLENAIRGRYEQGSTASPSGGSAFSAILEAYPNLDKVAFPYEQVQSAIFSGREAFKNQQTALLDLLRDYDTFTNRAGFLFAHKLMINMIGAPSDDLQARIGRDVKRGEAALEQMRLIVTDEDTNESFERGTDDGLDLGPATPTP